MRDLARARREAMQAYEMGRLLASLRVAFVIAPLTALCIWETRVVSGSLALGVTLFILATMVRWRQRDGFRIVATGMRTGALPLAAALALCRFAPWCPPDVALVVCGSAGVVSGGFIGRTMSQSIAAPWSAWMGAATMAGLTSALGCMALGAGTAIGAAVGVALGAAVAAGVPRRAAV